MTDRHLIITVEESDSTVGFYDSANGSEVGRVAVGFWPHEIEVSADGRTAYVTNFGVKDYDEQIGRPGWSISEIDIATRCEVRRLYTFREPFHFATRRAPHAVKLTPDGTKLFVNVEKNPRMLVFDLTDAASSTPARSFELIDRESGLAFAGPESIEPSVEYPLPEGTHNFLFDPSGAVLFVVAGRGGLSALEANTGRTLYHTQFFNSANQLVPVRGVTYTPDGKQLIASLRNEIRILEPTPAGFQTVRVLDNGGRGLGVGQLLYSEPTKAAADGSFEILAPAVWESQLLFVHGVTGEVIARVPTGLDPIHVALSPDGSVAYVSHGRSPYLSVIDVARRVETGRVPTHGGPNGVSVTKYSAPPKPSRITIGACLPLSGSFGVEGREIRIGYEYWRERVNAAGGILVKGVPHLVDLVFRDIGAHPPASPEIPKQARELIKTDGAQFLLGTYPSPANLEYAKVANETRTPLVIATGAGTDIYDPGFRHVFGIMSPARLYLAGTIEVVRMLVPRDEPTIAVLSCQDFAALEDAVATVRFAVGKGFKVVAPPAASLPAPFKIEQVTVTVGGTSSVVDIVTYPDAHTDFLQVLTLTARLDLDLCLVTGHLRESVALIAQTTPSGFRPRALGLSVGPSLASFRGQLIGQGVPPQQVEHLFGAAQWTDRVAIVGQDAFATPAEFARAFFERYSMKASYFSAGGYACGLVLQEAIRRADSLDADAVSAELRGIDLDTFFARIRFDHRGLNSTKPMYTIQLKSNGAEFDELILWPPPGGAWPRPDSV